MYQTSCECMIDKNWQDFWRFSLTLQPAVSQKMWCLVQVPAPLLWPLAGTLPAEGSIKGNIAGAIWKSTGVSWVALSAVMVAQSCARQIAVLISQDVCFAPHPIHQWLKFVLLSQLFLITQWLKGSSFIITHAVTGYFVLHNHTIKLIWSCPLEGNSRDNTNIKFTKG